jgi:hypothetical protein
MSDPLPSSPPDVASEVTAGEGLSLPQAARLLPSYRGGKAVNAATIWRWIVQGIVLPDGSCLRLEAVRLSGRWLTSRPALERFLRAQTPELAARPPAPPRTPVRREKAAARAAAALAAAGI